MIELRAMPFDSNEIITIDDMGEELVSYDRVAYSQDLADWMSTYFSNGILVQESDILQDELKVEHKSGMIVSIQPGAICINGRTGWNDEISELELSAGGENPRIDRIVAELNIPNDRNIYLKVIEGTPAEEPEPPELIKTEDIYQFSLAQCKVDALMATISSITDERESVSNVTIKIKPPSGNNAEYVTVSDEVADAFGLDDDSKDLESALQRVPIFSSYLAFCGNINTNMIDAAFGKNNENRIKGVGLALAMYAWFKGEDKDENPYTKLIKCDTLTEVGESAIDEILNSTILYDIISKNTYANGKVFDIPNMAAIWKKSYDIMSLLINKSEIIDKIRNEAWESWKDGWKTYTTRGEFTFTVPKGITCITYEIVGAGADAGLSTIMDSPDYYHNGASGGAYKNGVMKVVPGQKISGNISTSGTTFGTISLGKGGGASGGIYSELIGSTNGETPSQSGKFLKVSSGGKGSNKTGTGCGGGGGYGGGNGGNGGADGNGNVTSGGIGSNILQSSPNTGGAGGTTGYSSSTNGSSGNSGGGGGGCGSIHSYNGPGGSGGGGYGGGAGGNADFDGSGTTITAKGGSGCVVIYM